MKTRSGINFIVQSHLRVCLLVLAALCSSWTNGSAQDYVRHAQSGLAPSESVVLATLPGKEINGTIFTSETRFNWNGELGNWSYELLGPDVGKITQTYDEDGNNPNIYREELTLTFTSERAGSYVYKEFTGNSLTLTDDGGFALAFSWENGGGSDEWYADASQIANGWRYYDWFKGFKPEANNWIYHGRHGWLYVVGQDTSGLFLWDIALGRWLYTNATAYPWMYAYGPNEGWVFFFEGGRPGSRYFKRGDSGLVLSEQQLSAY